MPKGDKYIDLTRYLLTSEKDEIELSFEQIAIISGGLPPVAYRNSASWSDGSGCSLSFGWINAGYSARVRFKEQRVIFRKAKSSLFETEKESPQFETPSLDIFTATDSIRKYHSTANDGVHTRYRSWEHCYKAFQENRKNPDKTEFLCLHLAFYLASWGMLRNSFLLLHDYLVHKSAVIALTNAKFEPLFSNVHLKEDIPLILRASDVIRAAYFGNPVSDTLVTKILLGVFGCAPAFDRFFKSAAMKYKVCGGSLNEKSLKMLWVYYNKHFEVFEQLRLELYNNGIFYPPMKLMDMCLWQIGYDESDSKQDDSLNE